MGHLSHENPGNGREKGASFSLGVHCETEVQDILIYQYIA